MYMYVEGLTDLFERANHLRGIGGQVADRSHHTGRAGHEEEPRILALGQSRHQPHLQCGGNLSGGDRKLHMNIASG